MPFYTYILFSKSLNKFYIGSTSLSPVERLEQHNQIKFPDAFTRKGIPWEMFLVIECNSFIQAKAIELHIKKMKSTRYLQNLKQYPEIGENLLVKYRATDP